ncbi:MAG: PaaI family thioesterase [Actinobacteria bacterium]|nr:PaaI family thioesterase [Actinomycetota bacterium]
MAASLSDNDQEPTPSEDRRLADELRELIRLSRTSTADEPTRRAAIDHLLAARELLGSSRYPGPFWITGRSAFDHFEPTRDLQSLAPFSPAMGPANPIAPGIEIRVTDDDHVHGRVTLTEAYNGPPFDYVHGGVVALIYDDLVGMAAMLGSGGGMTARLTINYRRPTPMFEELEIEAWYDRSEGRKLFAKGEMRCNGEVLTDAEGLFIRPDSFPAGIPTT